MNYEQIVVSRKTANFSRAAAIGKVLNNYDVIKKLLNTCKGKFYVFYNLLYVFK